MKTIAKLIFYYFAYQLGFIFLLGGFTYAFLTIQHYWNTGFLIAPQMGQDTLFSVNLYAMLAGSIVYAWHLLHYRYVDKTPAVWSPVSAPLMLTIIPLTYGMMAWMNYLIEVIDIPDLYESLFLQLKNNPWGIMAVAVVAPVFEEILFRGAIEGHLLKTGRHPAFAIILSALLFGVVHGNPAQIPFAFVLGLVMGWLFYATGSLLPSMLLHFINNMSSVVLGLLFPQTSGSMEEMFGHEMSIGLSVLGLLTSVICIYIIVRILRHTSTNIKSAAPEQ